MKINDLNPSAEQNPNSKINRKYIIFSKLIEELKKKDLPEEIVESINNGIDQLNSMAGTERNFKTMLYKIQSTILKDLEKKLNLVTKNHYRNQWMAIGMSAFGLPLGVVFGSILGNMAFLGIGLPIGMVIGMAVGAAKDKKALEEGKVLDVEVA